MHHVVALIAERQKITCTNQSLSRLLSSWNGGGDGIATAAIMVLGDTCTRGYGFCTVKTSKHDPMEPQNTTVTSCVWPSSFLLNVCWPSSTKESFLYKRYGKHGSIYIADLELHPEVNAQVRLNAFAN
ncbi:putative lipoyl synthase [Helianthus anomalus]